MAHAAGLLGSTTCRRPIVCDCAFSGLTRVAFFANKFHFVKLRTIGGNIFLRWTTGAAEKSLLANR
jgi:hypothetical protein